MSSASSWFAAIYASFTALFLLFIDTVTSIGHGLLHALFLRPLGLVRAASPMPRAGSAVLITSCHSSIGRALALHLAKRGYEVRAGVRQEDEGKSLLAQLVAEVRQPGHEIRGRIHPFRLDVRNTDDLNAMEAAMNDANTPPLVAVINTAGVPAFAMDDTEEVGAAREEAMQVNFLGAMEVTRRLLPLLRRNRGRIINIGSLAGWYTVPGLGAYSASKAALHLATRELRIAEAKHGVAVSLIALGCLTTPSREKGHRVMEESRRGSQHNSAAALTHRMLRFIEANAAIEARQVACVVDRALHAMWPKRVYHVGLDAYAASMIRGPVGEAVVDWAVEQAYRVGC
jgi:NAD(P)-dependent dehydrogenase (short-subunit alcohol dehydrogenase family)